MLKKIISLFLIFGFICSCCGFAYTDEADTLSAVSETDEYKKQILLSFDIYVMPNSNGYITNGEFSKAILRSMGLYNNESESEAVSILKKSNIVPNELSFSTHEITKQSDSFKVVLNALGYGTVAKYMSYEKYVSQLDLNKNISQSDYLTWSDCINLLYNMLVTKVYDVESIYDNGSISYTQGDVFVSVYHDAIYLCERVLATEYAALMGYEDYMKESCVYIGGAYFEVTNNDISEQLGCEVEIFGLEQSENVYSVCGYVVTDNASEILIPLKNVMVVSGFEAGDPISDKTSPLIKYDDGQKEYTKRLSQNVKLVYNGMQTVDIVNSDLLGETGTLSLKDTNSDHTFDMVCISKYTPGRVLTLDEIYEKIVMDDGTEIDYSDADKMEITHNGRIADVKSVSTGTMVGIYEPKSYSETVSERIRIEIFSNIVNGTVTSIDTNNCVAGVGNEYYEFLPSLKDSIVLGYVYDFVIAPDGLVVFIVDRGQSGEYIYYLAHRVNDGLGAGLKIRAVDMNGNYNIYDVCQKVKYTGYDAGGTYVNGKIMTEAELTTFMDSMCTQHTLVRVRFKDEKISEIITPLDMSQDDNYKGYTTDKFTMDYSFTSGDYARRTDRLGLNHKAVSGQTLVVMDDLSNTDDGVEVVRYSAGNSAIVSEESYYMENAYIYDSDNELVVGVFVMTYDPEKNEVLNAAGSSVLYKATAMLVEKVTKAVNHLGDETYKVYGYMDGKRISYIAADTEVTQRYRTSWFERHCRYVGELKFGDVIVPATNSKGEMSEFFLLVSPDDENTVKTYIEPTSSSSNTAYGKVVNNYDNIIVRLDAAPERLFLITDSLIHYVCDMNKQKIYISDGTQYIYDSQSNTPDNMFILRWGLYTKQIVLYRY